jgi:hypothetical protein
MKEAVKQAMWRNKLCCEVGMQTENKSLLYIHEDNEACIAYSRNPVKHSTMKHIKRELYWIQESVACDEMKLISIPTNINKLIYVPSYLVIQYCILSEVILCTNKKVGMQFLVEF